MTRKEMLEQGIKKRYVGQRLAECCEVYVIDSAGRQYPLPLRLEIFNHSPSYQDFKREVVAGLSAQAFEISSEEIDAWAARPKEAA